MFSQEELQKSINNLKKMELREPSPTPPPSKEDIFDSLVQEIKNLSPAHLKKVGLPPSSKNFITEEIIIFNEHTTRIKQELAKKVEIIQSIRKRLVEDEIYNNHLKSIRNFKFVIKTFLDKNCIFPKEEFMYDIEKSRFKLNKVYEGDFYILKSCELKYPQPQKKIFGIF